MKQQIYEFLKKLYPKAGFDTSYPPEGFGDYSTNIAFLLAKEKGENPQKIAEETTGKLKDKFADEFEKIEIAKNGFINFHLSRDYLLKQLGEFLKSKIKFPKTEKQKINLEFVSANPTGPLTLGNARSAAYGDTLANILGKAGHKVIREYFINDIGTQVELLSESIKRRLQQLEGENVDFPEELYQGGYIIDLAKKAKENKIPTERIKDFAIQKNLGEIRESLAKFGVKFDVWFKESSLSESDEVKSALTHLEHSNLTYKKEGAVWFKGRDSGLDKDVALVRSEKAGKAAGAGTYLLSDFAYAKNKLNRDFDLNIYILGADHYDDSKRLKAGIKALNLPEEKFIILIHQLVALKRGDEILRMAKRKGIYVTLDDLLEQIPKDVARYFFLEKSLDTHLEFDLELAKEESNKNPVYYIQYAFARINSVFGKAGSIKIASDLKLLNGKEELDLIRYLIRFPEIIFDISQNYQVHHLAQYAYELANRFHKFYETQRIISDDRDLTEVRLALITAVKNVLGETLTLMGLESPKRM